MKTLNFYDELPSFKDFSQIFNGDNFVPIPPDWDIIITDVKGSTQAVETGRYKDVNTVGVAAIVTVNNILKDFEFPYVFGGDGATLIIPNSKTSLVTRKLLGLKKLSREKFSLELRIGVVSVKEVTQGEGRVEVAKLRLVANKSVAIMRGGGLTLAEDKVKKEYEKYGLKDDSGEVASLEGLSCRWQAIENKNGKIISLLIKAKDSNKDKIYGQFLKELNSIIGKNIEIANPVNFSQMKYKSFKECLMDEIRYHDSLLSVSFIKRFLEICFSVSVFKFGFNAIFFNSSDYAESMKIHSDYRKFDDVLRMILDVTEKQDEIILNYLKDEFQKGQLFYGRHESQNSLMTCYVSAVSEGNHIHFIDGGDGGYAFAAKNLKAQIDEELRKN